MSRFTVFIAVCACAVSAVTAYGALPVGSASAPIGYASAPIGYGPAPTPVRKVVQQVVIPDIAILPDQAEAKASAQSLRVGAQATSQQINAKYFNALDAYAKQIGKPLLVKNYGQLTNLYAAALPARSYVAQIDPEFVQGPYGKIQHISETSLGLVAV